MSSEFLHMLLDMGFSKEQAEKGLSMTGNVGVEPAMEWIFNHGNEFEPGTSTSALNSGSASDKSIDNSNEEDKAAEMAKSLQCDECGKLFTTQDMVEFHAAKTGHSKFSESTEEKKPLTEEEKKEQMRKIEELLKLKRQEREEKEKEEALQREKARVRSGRDLTEAKKKMEELEMKKLIDERKRDKEEEKQARLKIKQLIEEDKLARKKAAESANAKENEQQTVTEAPKPIVSQTSSTRNYSETKIQLRLTDGQTLTQTFNVNEQLSAVRLFIELNRTDGDAPFSLMTNFPRKFFADQDYDRKLIDLGLVPSAVIFVARVAAQPSSIVPAVD